MKPIFKKFIYSSPIYSSVKRTFKYHFRRHFMNVEKNLIIYEDKVVILSVFLLISSSFMFKSLKEKKFNFDWQSYLSIFKPHHMQSFILCSIRYLMDEGIIKDQEIVNLSGLKDNFLKQYKVVFESKRKVLIKTFDEDVNIAEYLYLMRLVLKIHSIYNYEIPKDSSKVVELVDYTTEWKSKLFEVFNYKSEYIMFAFFVNLSR